MTTDFPATRAGRLANILARKVKRESSSSMAEMKTDAATLAQEAGNFERISGDLKTQIDQVVDGRFVAGPVARRGGDGRPGRGGALPRSSQ